MKTKLHLDKPRDKRFDREALLEYYDQFFFLPQYARIKPRHFQLKTLNPRRRSRPSKVAFSPESLAFETLNEEMDLEDKSGSDNDDDDKDDQLNPLDRRGQRDESLEI